MRKTQRAAKILIVGLGNIDKRDTRHSVGMQAVDWLAAKVNADWSANKQLKAMVARKAFYVSSDSSSVHLECHLLKSKIPMNGNGTSVRRAAHLYSVDTENIYLICDELDKAVGKFSVKETGSARGHNGVKSVFNCMSTDNIARLVIGIDRPASKSEVESYVLSNFSVTEKERVAGIMSNACAALLQLIEQRLQIDPQQLVSHFVKNDNIVQSTQKLQRQDSKRTPRKNIPPNTDETHSDICTDEGEESREYNKSSPINISSDSTTKITNYSTARSYVEERTLNIDTENDNSGACKGLSKSQRLRRTVSENDSGRSV